MATGMAFPVQFSSARGVQIETDPFRKKVQNVRLALTAPPNFYPLLSSSGNPLFALLQNTPLSMLVPATIIYYCRQAVEPFVKGVRIRDLGEGSDVQLDFQTGEIKVLLYIDFLDLEASAVAVFSPVVENPSTSGFRLLET